MSELPIDICICTFRRAHIAETLRSLITVKLRLEWKLRIIVADNDETPSAKELVEKTAHDAGFLLHYVHAPACNISIARNACLDAATAPYVAFIDDDELVTPGWLIAMMEKMESSNCDVVLGPVFAVYGADCPAWISKGDYHSTLPIMNEKKTFSGWGLGNVLLRRTAPSVQHLRFRKELGKTGGEDTLFFASIQKDGGRFDFAPEATVTEAVLKNRASLMWLIKRRFRSGQTHGALLLEANTDGVPGYIRNAMLASAKTIFCFFSALINIARPVRMRYWLLRGAVHAGALSRLLGKTEIIQYGHTEGTP